VTKQATAAHAEIQLGQVIDANPIINDAFEEPTRQWEFGEGAPQVVEGRRVAGYIPPAPKGEQLRITDEVVRLDHVNLIRERLKEWREDGYPGATPITKELFSHWFDPERELRPFFAQREAIETIAFLTEAAEDRRQGLDFVSHEDYTRWAVKLATGAGKTLVMAMTIVWSGINKRASRQDRRFADAFLVVCPNLTVKERLRGADGLLPADPESTYTGFDLIPGPYTTLFGQVKVMVVNWHQLAPKEERRYRVLRRGPETDSAFARRVLADLGDKRRIMVLNDPSRPERKRRREERARAGDGLGRRPGAHPQESRGSPRSRFLRDADVSGRGWWRTRLAPVRVGRLGFRAR
jgi:type III restriction enzyme